MMQTFASMFRNKEIRNKIFFTLAMLLIYRIGSAIPVPGVDASALADQIRDNSILSIMNLLGGGALLLVVGQQGGGRNMAEGIGLGYVVG